MEAVGSSRSNTEGLRKAVLRNHTNCRCPPDKCCPPGPTASLYDRPWNTVRAVPSMNACPCFSVKRPSLPYRTFYLMDRLNSIAVCGTTATRSRTIRNPHSTYHRPSRYAYPSEG